MTILKKGGCIKVWLNGSFVTTKDEPGDFDCVWETTGVDRKVIASEDPELFDFTNGRATQKARFGGEFLPNITEASTGKSFSEFFQQDRDGTAKGIVAIDLEKEKLQ